MPKDNIERAIKKAAGGDTENYEAIRYEGYGPGGVAVIVEALTDNRNRTGGAVRAVFTKYGGNLGATGVGRAHVRPRRRDRLSGRGRLRRRDAGGRHRGRRRRRRRPTPSGHVITCAFETSARCRRRWRRSSARRPRVKALWKPTQTTAVDEEKAASMLKLIAGARGRRRRAERLLQLRGLRRGAGQADGADARGTLARGGRAQ